MPNNEIITIDSNEKHIEVPNFKRLESMNAQYDAKNRELCVAIERMIIDKLSDVFGSRQIAVVRTSGNVIDFIFSYHPLKIKKFIISPAIIAKIIDQNFTFFEKRAYTKECLAEVCIAAIELFIVNLQTHSSNIIIVHQLREILDGNTSSTETSEALMKYIKDVLYNNNAGYEISGYTCIGIIPKKKIVKIMKIFINAMYKDLHRMLTIEKIDSSALSLFKTEV